MACGKLFILPGAPTASCPGENQYCGQADAGLSRHAQKQVIQVEPVLTGSGQVSGEGLDGVYAVPR